MLIDARAVPAVCALFAILVRLVLPPAAAATAGPSDYDVAGGHYYDQGLVDRAPDYGSGFQVLDDEVAPFWGEFRRLGGAPILGYPISNRYECDGAVCQAFQLAVFKWSVGAGEVELLDVFDWLHRTNRDAWLDQRWGIPPWSPGPASARPKKAKKEMTGEPFAVLDDNPTLKSAYWRLGSRAPSLYGLPRSYRTAAGLAVLRTQRAAFVQPVGSPGQVELLPAGSVFRDAGLVPPAALVPGAAPEPSDATPPTRISAPALGIDAVVIPLEMRPDGELPTPDNGRVVAWYSYGARLGEGGNAVLAGHVDWDREPGAFWRLREAEPGQVFTLHGAAGQAYDYRVDWVRAYPAESLAGLTALRPGGGGMTLTLVTCGGRFDLATRSYDDRHVVRATLVGRRS